MYIYIYSGIYLQVTILNKPTSTLTNLWTGWMDNERLTIFAGLGMAVDVILL